VTRRPHGQKVLPLAQCVVIGANIRVLRRRKGWNQRQLGELMGWDSGSTVCAAEGRREGRQRRFTSDEVTRLAAIFGTIPQQLTTRCAQCGGHPPDGYACLACGAPGSMPGGPTTIPGMRAAPSVHATSHATEGGIRRES
jgi:hypothetical protein